MILKKSDFTVNGGETSPFPIMEAGTKLSMSDYLGSWKARWGVNRLNYKVLPGLYKVGTPTNVSPVLVTANYKLTFDCVRKELTGLDLWLLVLDTKGVNVWCAAGKGTFGTDELIDRLNDVGLKQVVNHRTLILPQLGAPGVAAPVVYKETDFRIIYGPVYAKDIRSFLQNNCTASSQMRSVRFDIRERLKVIPVEIVLSWWFLPIAFTAMTLFRIIAKRSLSTDLFFDFLPFAAAYFTGTMLFQIVLPWLPGRSFAFKGWLLGMLCAISVNTLIAFPQWQSISHLFTIPVIVSFFALNFTGSTTFTSRSGVLKETRIAIPLLVAGLVIGIVIRVVPELFF